MSDEKQECDKTPGIIGWSELLTPSKTTSVEFYSKLFGWNTEDMEMPSGDTYTIFKLGDRPIAGCFTPPEGAQVPSMWLNYINVEDLDASVEKAQALGATVCTERKDIPMGSFTVMADPHGSVFAFWQGSGETC